MLELAGSRRNFMRVAGLGIIGACVGETAGAGERPPEIGRKFQADGRVRPFAGNTIISHVPQQGIGFAAFDRLLDIYRDLPACSFARKVTALPPSSYHMTIFNGPTDQGRNGRPWPEGVPADAPIEQCNAILAERLASINLGCRLPIRMVVDDRTPPNRVTPITLDLRPADDTEALKLKQVRDRIEGVLKMGAADLESYQFHITIAYQVGSFTPAEQAEYESSLKKWRSRLLAEQIAFEFDAPEYCVFEDMFSFRRQFLLAV